jgi:hypothetical protein
MYGLLGFAYKTCFQTDYLGKRRFCPKIQSIEFWYGRGTAVRTRSLHGCCFSK